MDAWTLAEVAHLLIDIRNNLEWQNQLLAGVNPGAPPERYEDRIRNNPKTSFKEQLALARQRKEDKKNRKKNRDLPLTPPTS